MQFWCVGGGNWAPYPLTLLLIWPWSEPLYQFCISFPRISFWLCYFFLLFVFNFTDFFLICLSFSFHFLQNSLFPSPARTRNWMSSLTNLKRHHHLGFSQRYPWKQYGHYGMSLLREPRLTNIKTKMLLAVFASFSWRWMQMIVTGFWKWWNSCPWAHILDKLLMISSYFYRQYVVRCSQ